MALIGCAGIASSKNYRLSFEDSLLGLFLPIIGIYGGAGIFLLIGKIIKIITVESIYNPKIARIEMEELRTKAEMEAEVTRMRKEYSEKSKIFGKVSHEVDLLKNSHKGDSHEDDAP